MVHGGAEPQDAQSPPPPPARRRPRWGLRTLGFLILALVATITSTTLGHHTAGTFGSLVFGLVGAGYSSVKGVRDVLDRGMYGYVLDRRRSRR